MVTDQLKMMEDEQFRYLRMKLASTTDPEKRKELKEQLDKLNKEESSNVENQTLLVE